MFLSFAYKPDIAMFYFCFDKLIYAYAESKDKNVERPQYCRDTVPRNPFYYPHSHKAL